MEGSFHHLAQMNIAAMRAPLDDPLMTAFVARIDEINRLAEAAPGFVWRWCETAAKPFDSRTLFNLSVWKSVESLRTYVYRGPHVELFRSRKSWFVPRSGPTAALWWIPAGHKPTPEEAAERLAWLEENGSGPFAFGFRGYPAPPASPPPADAPAPMLYDRKVFYVTDSSNIGIGVGTCFRYRSRVWAIYDRDDLRFGALVAAADRQGRLDARSRHISGEGVLCEGACESIPVRLPDGRLRLRQHWRWAAETPGSGCSILDEAPLA